MDNMIRLLLPAIWETLYMVFWSTIFATILGGPLGVLLLVTKKDNILPMPKLNRILDATINILRSFPFIILMILVFPLSRIIVGTTIGSTATIVPLSISAAPFVARIIEGALSEVDKGLIEASLSLGASPFEIIIKVLIPEAMPSIINGLTITIISLLGYSAMAGAIGGGGLGDLAIRYGYQRFKIDIMIISVIVIIVLVQIIQYIGDRIVFYIKKNR
ncbi:MAG: D-methionine transport system permease protein [Fusobacteriaceae bacterium]|jgi:D-methionine transport system permease protein|nr:D-methionine transport system permease protein [Fusobacteriaceae bacterium]